MAHTADKLKWFKVCLSSSECLQSNVYFKDSCTHTLTHTHGAVLHCFIAMTDISPSAFQKEKTTLNRTLMTRSPRPFSL